MNAETFLFSACICAFVSYGESNSMITIHPQHPIYVLEGNNLTVDCSINRMVSATESLYWKARGMGKDEKQKSKDVTFKASPSTVGTYTVKMKFTSVDRSDAGIYQCIYKSNSRQYSRGIFLKVFLKGNSSKTCSTSQFRCGSSGMCIPLENVCDGFFDCYNKEDEKCKPDEKPVIKYPVWQCKGPHKFRCHNGNCIDQSLVCDTLHNNDCGDWSDEYCLIIQEPTFEAANFINTTDSENADKEDSSHLAWLKTRVYAVIGCTVSVILLIALIVITFRIRMKQSFDRSRRRHRNYRNSYHSAENDPILNLPPSNIIVNVNNGVQYIPGNEFTSIMRSPPAYSEIGSDPSEGRISPPPPYTTLDRNPLQRNVNFDDYVIRDFYLTSACVTCLPSLSRDSSVISDSESYIQIQLGSLPPTQNVSVQTTQAMSSPHLVTPQIATNPSVCNHSPRGTTNLLNSSNTAREITSCSNCGESPSNSDVRETICCNNFSRDSTSSNSNIRETSNRNAIEATNCSGNTRNPTNSYSSAQNSPTRQATIDVQHGEILLSESVCRPSDSSILDGCARQASPACLVVDSGVISLTTGTQTAGNPSAGSRLLVEAGVISLTNDIQPNVKPSDKLKTVNNVPFFNSANDIRSTVNFPTGHVHSATYCESSNHDSFQSYLPLDRITVQSTRPYSNVECSTMSDECQTSCDCPLTVLNDGEIRNQRSINQITDVNSIFTGDCIPVLHVPSGDVSNSNISDESNSNVLFEDFCVTKDTTDRTENCSEEDGCVSANLDEANSSSDVTLRDPSVHSTADLIVREDVEGDHGIISIQNGMLVIK